MEAGTLAAHARPRAPPSCSPPPSTEPSAHDLRARFPLCDEPTGALDSKTGRLALEAIAEVNRRLGTTVALITHNAVIGDIADRVLLMRDGRIGEARRNPRRRPASAVEW
jgi:putative ABC transport system ATP-binding protein